MKKMFLIMVMVFGLVSSASATIGGYVKDLRCDIASNAKTVSFQWQYPGLKHGWIYINSIEQADVWGYENYIELIEVDASEGDHVLVLYFDFYQQDYGQSTEICNSNGLSKDLYKTGI